MSSTAASMPFSYGWDDPRPSGRVWNYLFSHRRPPETDMISGTELTSEEQDWRLEFVVRRLIDLAELPPNWNTYGAPPISEYALSSAMQFAGNFLIKHCVPLPDIIPTSDGRVQFEWHRNAIDLEIEFGAGSEIDLVFEDLNSGQECERTLTTDLSSVRPILDRLC